MTPPSRSGSTSMSPASATTAFTLRTWERGAGLTRACGTGACATAVAAIASKRAASPVKVTMKGGSLTIAWAPGGRSPCAAPPPMSSRARSTWRPSLMSAEAITLGCRLNFAESEGMRALRRRRHDHRQQLRGDRRGRAPDPPGDPPRPPRAAGGADRRHGLRGAAGAGAFRAMPEVTTDRQCSRITTSHPRPERTSPSKGVGLTSCRHRPPAAAGFRQRVRSFVAVQTGCDHRCTFCTIWQARGPSRSLPFEAIRDAIARELDAGAEEIVLTGVDITSYEGGLGPLCKRCSPTFRTSSACACRRSTASRSTRRCWSWSRPSRA